MFKTKTKGESCSSLGFGHFDFEHSDLFRASYFGFRIYGLRIKFLILDSPLKTDHCA
jgi:hypothetical protein